MNSEVRELAFSLSHGYCRCKPDCMEKADQIHHMLPNTKINKARFPLFIDSIFNYCPIFNGCHLNKPIPKISEHEAEIYETYLRMCKEEEL